MKKGTFVSHGVFDVNAEDATLTSPMDIVRLLNMFVHIIGVFAPERSSRVYACNIKNDT